MHARTKKKRNRGWLGGCLYQKKKNENKNERLLFVFGVVYFFVIVCCVALLFFFWFFFNIRFFTMRLGVEIMLIEAKHPRKHFFILFIHELLVGVLTVPWIEGVKTNDVQGFGRQCTFIVYTDLIHVLVVAPTHHHIFKPTSFFVFFLIFRSHENLYINTPTPFLGMFLPKLVTL